MKKIISIRIVFYFLQSHDIGILFLNESSDIGDRGIITCMECFM